MDELSEMNKINNKNAIIVISVLIFLSVFIVSSVLFYNASRLKTENNDASQLVLTEISEPKSVSQKVTDGINKIFSPPSTSAKSKTTETELEDVTSNSPKNNLNTPKTESSVENKNNITSVDDSIDDEESKDSESESESDQTTSDTDSSDHFPAEDILDLRTPALSTAIPNFEIGGGKVTIGNVCLGCDVFYTLDGSDPTTSSLRGSSVNNVVQINNFHDTPSTVTMKAKIVKDNDESSIVSKTYFLPKTPTFTTGNYPSDIYPGVVSVNPTTLPIDGAITIVKPEDCPTCKIYYCLNCQTPQTGYLLPNAELIEYVSPITITESTYVSAFSVSSDGIVSRLFRSHNYNLLQPPVFSNQGGLVDSGTTVILSTNTNQSIYYTLDGSEPTRQSLTYSSPISIFETTTIKAKIINIYNMHSQTISKTFTIGENSISEFQLFSEITPALNNNYGLATKIISNPLDSSGFKEFVVLYKQYFQFTGRRYRLVSYRYNVYSKTLVDKKEIYLNFKNNGWSGAESLDVYHIADQKYVVITTNGIKKIDFSLSTSAFTGVLWEYDFSTITNQNNTYAGISTTIDSQNNLVFTGRVSPNVTSILLLKMNVSSDLEPTNIWHKSFTASCEIDSGNVNPHSCYSSYIKSKFILVNNNLFFYYLNNGIKSMLININNGDIIWDLNKTSNQKSITSDLFLKDGSENILYTDVISNNYIVSKINKTNGSAIWETLVSLPEANVHLAPSAVFAQNSLIIFYSFHINNSSFSYLKEFYKINLTNGTFTKISLPQPMWLKIPGNRTYDIKKGEFNSTTNDLIYLFNGVSYSGVLNGSDPNVSFLKIDSSFTPYAYIYPRVIDYGVFSQYAFGSRAVDFFTNNNSLYVYGYSAPPSMDLQYTENKIFISKFNFVNSKLPVFDSHRQINISEFNYSFNKDVYWSDPRMESKPNVHFELLDSGFGLVFVPNLMNKTTDGLVTLFSIIDLNDQDYKNSFTLTAPSTLTPVVCNDGSSNYCVSFNLNLSEVADIGIFPSAVDFSVFTENSFIYSNSFDPNPKITKHWQLNDVALGVTTHSIKSNMTDSYYINIYSYSRTDNTPNNTNQNITKRQLHRILVNAVN